MIEETVRVVGTAGKYAWVEGERRGACGGCASQSSCGTSAWGKVLGQRPVRLKAINPIGAREGESVVIGVRDEALLRGSFVVYLLPLLVMFAAALLAQGLAPRLGDGFVALAGIGGLAAALLVVRGFGRKAENDERYQAVVLRREPGYAPIAFMENKQRREE